MKRLEDFLRPTQEELFRRLCKMYPSKIVNEGQYILVPGEAPVRSEERRVGKECM